MRRIETEADLAEGSAFLAGVCPVMARIIPAVGPLPLRRRADGFPAILDAVISQQISTAAAAAIAGRMAAAGLETEAALRAASDEDLRLVGLSRPKQKYLRGIAEARLDWGALRDLPDEEVIAQLTALPGIGRWTADIYLKFALGRADAFAAGDLALAEAARVLYELPARPGPKALTELATPWRPWRSVAARVLWSYYRQIKGREGVR
ncbi:DNA-3-methyladenine glycosylase family protein [Paracoccus aminophilus]|uniref:DNA-3-methyladenine glycosylase II n=1 Tax=Paracoccus aminophilus JCM 7686 TaxID=1367847 RepID=S5YVB1_PARAH|nr:DNA-3-methyladenine glycosylase [Paracoccus aminophilus]AGT09136.1 DNA-3-methyladenine glycosylase II [Paracoccus aminophilus JCM 7686]